MPRTQNEILKDMFIAHNESNNEKWLENAKSLISLLEYRNMNKVAAEFRKILLPDEIKAKSENVGVVKEPITLFGEDYPLIRQNETNKKPKKETAWQVSRGAEVNFNHIYKLVEYLSLNSNKSASNNVLNELLGFSEEKAQGFSRILYFLGLLTDRKKELTDLAKIIYQYDSYFEDIGTLWFLHYVISSNPNFIIWNRLTNILFHSKMFSDQDSKSLFEDQRESHAEYSFKHHLNKEFNLCINAYTKSKFSKLNIIELVGEKEFQKTIPSYVPDIIVLACILLYKKRFYPYDVGLEIPNLINEINSPGRLLYKNEYDFRDALDKLRQERLIIIESFANLDQIKFLTSDDHLEVLKLYYKSKQERT